MLILGPAIQQSGSRILWQPNCSYISKGGNLHEKVICPGRTNRKSDFCNKRGKGNARQRPGKALWGEVQAILPVFTTGSRSQIVTLKKGQNIKYLPYVFTEQGVAMLSSVLKSERAVQVNILIMRIFVKLRRILSTHKELANKIKELEQRVGGHDNNIRDIFSVIRKLLQPPKKQHRKIGFIQ